VSSNKDSVTNINPGRFESIANEWDKAEKAIKLAEQVCDSVVIPAVAELRYAGRRIVDAINAAKNGCPSEQVEGLIADAEFDCHRSIHDAIDAALNEMSIQTDLLAKEMGYDVVNNSYPEFVDFSKKLVAARQQIASSRGDRDNRQAIYESIIQTDFSNIVENYQDLRNSETKMKIIVAAKRAGLRITIALFIIGTIFNLWLWANPVS